MTDGQANLPAKFIEEFRRKEDKQKFECLSALIGGEVDIDTVEKFSDKIIDDADFMEADEAFSGG